MLAHAGTWVNLTMYYELCTQSFNFASIGVNQTAWPDVTTTNYDFGGLDLEAFNLIFTNGVEDPWRHASLDQSKGQMVSILINCTDCAHCVDLYNPTPNDSPQLKLSRNIEVFYFSTWLQDYWNGLGLTATTQPKLDAFMSEYLRVDDQIEISRDTKVYRLN